MSAERRDGDRPVFDAMRLLRPRRSPGCWFALAAVIAASCGEHVPDGVPAADVALMLAPYFGELKTVKVTVGDDTLTMLFDTGGGATLVTPAVAHRMGCQPSGRDVGFRMTGEPVEFQRCDSVTLGSGDWSRLVEPLAVFDVNALLPPQLPRLDGVLALDAFRGEVVTIDWPGERVTVHAHTTGDAALASNGLPIRPATGESGRMFTVLTRVNGRRGPLWFLIDSGNLRGVLVDSQVLADSALAVGPDSLVELRIGPHPPVQLPAHQARLIMDGALGTDFLQRGPVTLDLRPLRP